MTDYQTSEFLSYSTLHNITDRDKVETLAAEMQANGWQGAPLIAWDDNLITGVHRSAAADKVEITPPVIQLEDVFAEAGIDWAKSLEDVDDYDFGVAVVLLCNDLPWAIKDKYGIDVG